MSKRRTKMVQLELRPRTWGGRRDGAGRPKKKGAGLPHSTRPELARRFPVHVTLKVVKDVGSLRRDGRFALVKRAFRRGLGRFDMQLVEFSVQHDHIHMIVEAESREALARAIQALAIRIAKSINFASGRHGRVFKDRYHARILRTPAEVRNAVHYVLRNWHKHTKGHRWYVDPCSSMSGEAVWWVERHGGALSIVLPPRTWLLRRSSASA